MRLAFPNSTFTNLIVSLLYNKFQNKLAPKVPNNIPRNLPLCSFASCLIVSVTLFINKPHSSGDLTIFIKSFISSFEIINAAVPDPNNFLWINASVSDATADNPNGIKTLFAYVLSTFPTKGHSIVSNGSESLPKNPIDCPTLCNYVFDNFKLAAETFAKALQSFETFVLVNNNLCRKLFSSLESPTKLL